MKKRLIPFQIIDNVIIFDSSILQNNSEEITIDPELFGYGNKSIEWYIKQLESVLMDAKGFNHKQFLGYTELNGKYYLITNLV